jgi:hypothetical protein
VRWLWKPVDDALHSLDRRHLRRRLWLWRAADWKTFRRIDEMTNRAILIGGCGRSGTTVLKGLLSCHPEIQAVDIETSAFCQTAYHGRLDLDADFRLERVFRRLLLHDIPSGCSRWVEKTPKNVLFAERALDYLGPGARFIHIVRDGRDVVTSRHRRAPDRYWVSPQRWVMDVNAGRALEKNPRVITVRYEDLVNDVEGQLRRLCDFLGLRFEDRMLRYPEMARVPRTEGWLPRLRPISARSVGRWRGAEHREAVGALLSEPGAVSLMRHYGYLDSGAPAADTSLD